MRRCGSALGSLLLLTALLLHLAVGHVRLTFPPARYPALDFLDSVRTSPPCGVPKPPIGKGIRTSIASGSTFNITWFTAFPHHGGYRIEVLNEKEEPISVLTSADNQFVSEDDATRDSQTVTLPEDLECSNCAIRLLRQATEWGPEYQFFSCADVNIVKLPGPDTCLGHGMRKNGTCECDRLYSGLACQNADECWADHDCGVNGKCQETSSSEYPQRRCYCKQGFYGDGCQKRSDASVRSSEFDESLYQLREVGEDKNRIYWRIVDDEIEVVLKFPGLSWVALGWKPQTQDKTCASIAQYSGADETGVAEPTSVWGKGPLPEPGGATAEPEPTAEGTSSAHPEPGAEPGTNATSPDLPSLPARPIVTVPVGVGNVSEIACAGAFEVFTTCPEFNRLCEASCEWTSNPDSIPGCPRACGAAKCVCTEGYVRAANANDTCVPFNDCAPPSGTGAPTGVTAVLPSSANETACAGNSSWAECGIACEPTCENMHDTEPCPAVCETPACTCVDTFVRHNGRCIYWGDCPEGAGASQATNSPSAELETAPFALNSSAFVTNVPINVEIPIVTTPPQAGGQNLSCGLNETINECGTICEPDCQTVFTRKQCDICGTPSCSCIQGYARQNGQCVYWGDCPTEAIGLETAPTTAGSISHAALDITPIIQTTVKAVPPPRATGGGRGNSTAFSSKTRPGSLPSINPTPQIVESAAPDSTGAPAPPAAGKSEVIGDVCYGDWRWPAGCRDCDYRVSWNYLDDTDEIEFSIETRAPTNWWTGIGFSSTGTMTQADMIIVKSQNGALSLHDMYSEGYSAPRDDAEKNVYTPTVIGTHVNGVLRAQFTRKRDTGDTTSDHRFTDATCYKFLFPVSGGRLDENGKITKHLATPMVSEKKVCIRSCLAPEVTKAASTCQREYKHPAGCEGAACEYVAKWEYSPSRKDIRFEISAREIGRWTGIGFSRDGGMTNSDIYTGWFYEGKAYVTDRFAYGRQLPAVDPTGRQDIYEAGGRVEDDVQTIWFRRKVVTEDALTDYPLDKCYYFLFPVGGGRVLARKAADFQQSLTPIGYHDLYQPRVSREKICICDGNGVSIAAEEGVSNATSRHRRQADPFSAQVDPQVGLPPKADGNATAEPAPLAEPSLNGTSNEHHDDSLQAHESPEVEPHAEGSANTTAPHSEPEPASEPTASTEPEPEAHDHAHSEPEPHPEGHASNETHAEPEPETTGEPASEPHGDHDHDHDHGHAEPEPHPTGEAAPEPHPSGEAEPEPKSEPEGSAEPSAGWSGHAMDCTDIVVGTAIGATTQVRDYYTISRATPRLDDYYGGKQSITSATGYEEDGITTIVFRKKLKADDKTDHSIVPGPMTVIWAKGQQYPNYVHNVEPSVFAAGKAGNAEFYENDVLMYHGAKNRGMLTLDFFEGMKAAAGDCSGMFAYPSGCTDAACTYVIKWTSDGKTVSFQLDTAIPVGHWSGIGFSKDGAMSGADVMIAIVQENGAVEVSDQYAQTYGRPIVDANQGVFGVTGQYQNGRLMANFSRNLDTNDAANDLPLTECQFFLYPHSGGALEGGSVAIRKHTSTPTSSSKKICLQSCSSDVSSISIPTKKPNANEPEDVLQAHAGFSTKQQVPRYSLVFRITNLEWNDKLADVNGAEFMQLSGPVKQAIDQVLAEKWPGMEVSNVVKFTPGSVLAHVEVTARDSSQEPTPAELIAQVESRAAAGRIGTFEIEPTTIRAARLNKEDHNPSPEEIRNWIIIGVAGLLVLIAILFAVCMILRTRKTKSKDFKSNSRYVPFSPYSYMFNQAYPGTYPGGYQFPPGPMTDKPKGFDNQAYQSAGQHSRQFSQATTATNNGGKGSPGSSSEVSPDGSSPPAGVGETTYQEWYQKVASNPASQQHQEVGDRPPPPKQSPSSSSRGGRGAYGGPYVSYPNDPMNYYTLNGQHRVGGYPVGRGAMPPPGYYRPY